MILTYFDTIFLVEYSHCGFKKNLIQNNFFGSWGQDIQTHDIKDTSSNTPESCNARNKSPEIPELSSSRVRITWRRFGQLYPDL